MTVHQTLSSSAGALRPSRPRVGPGPCLPVTIIVRIGDATAGQTDPAASNQPVPASATVASICQSCVADLDGSAGVVSVMTQAGYRASAHATDPVAGQLDEDQFTLGEGPSLDAFASAEPVLAVDLGVLPWRTRWPLFVPAAHRASFCAVLAFPLLAGARSVGVLTVYGSEPAHIDDQRLTRARTAADRVTMTLLAGPGGSSPRLDDANDVDGSRATAAADGAALPGSAPRDGAADDGTFYRAEIYQASGMVMAQLDSTIDQAMIRLRAYAFAHDEPLHEVARRVVSRQMRFDREAR